ncbi:MAG: xanthine dehydrogenase family protein molybdopterin-binding subunit [Acetobacteraceae bacterium]|nr:xanthine dehydrogenase family protein molybdopterin-binding subunit [Acetobacteraceae bacterium]
MPHDQGQALIATGIGAPVRRVEDLRLLRGLGRYTDDLDLPGALHAVFVRSPYASARILAVDVSAALALPGVVAAYTGADLAHLAPLPCLVPRQLPDGRPMPRPPYRALAVGAARHVGDPVAMVVAETRAAALDAAEAVAVEYDPLPAVTDPAEALSPDAPAVWPDLPDGNLAFRFALGDEAAVAAALARAAHVVSLDFRMSRITANPMEPRAALAEWDPGTERFTLRSGLQNPHGTRDALAAVFGVPAGSVRVISPDMGGGFGMRGQPTQEHVALLFAARALGRPVRWAATRTEAIQSDPHARDQTSTVELALDAEGHFLALRCRTVANMGAYLALMGPLPPTNNLGGLAGVYRTPAISAEVLGVFTHTQPTAPYRGAGRPEAIYALERAIDLAAVKLGLDRVEIRRRNLIPKEALPFRTGLVFTYDSGDFARGMEIALAAADWAGFPARRAEAAARGRLRGIGIANAIEISAGPPRTPQDEGAEIRFAPDGSATVLLGAHNHGQGHETVFRQMLSDMLGLPFHAVRIVMGDTDAVPYGRGTFGSRSIVAAGTALKEAADRIVARGRRIAAHLLEAAVEDIEFEAGRFRIAGTDRSLGFAEIARASVTPGALPKGEEGGLIAAAIRTPQDATFPNGCHVCEAEVDPETGEVQVLRYVIADDVGTVINPLLMKGQLHGGVAQGLGQALLENVVFEPGSGQLLSASFMDYAMPRAADMPPVEILGNHHPTASNPLGAKGAGEAGTVGALPAVVSAVVDALSPLGVTHLDMPLTPLRVWQAIRAARG